MATAKPDNTIMRRFLPRSERDLMVYIGALLWALTTVSIFGASFFKDLAPDNVAFWRLTMGVPAALLTVTLFAAGTRVGPRGLRWLTALAALLAIPVNVILLQITPATWAILINLWALTWWVGYFASRRELVGYIILLTLTALTPVFFDFPQNAEQHTLSRLAVYLPVTWAVALVFHSQRITYQRVLGDLTAKTRLDPLTGAANAVALREAAEHAFAQAGGSNDGWVGVLMVDIDNFKSANSLYGHLGGDRALGAVAKQLLRVGARRHLVARIGGDEFAILIPGTSREDLAIMANLYRGAVVGASAELALEGVELDASVGVASYPDDGSTLDALLTAADRSMYEVKAEHHQQAARHEHFPTHAPDAAAGGKTAPGRLRLVAPSVAAMNFGIAANERDARSAAGFVNRCKGWFDSRAQWGKVSGSAWALGSVAVLVSLQMPDADRSQAGLASAAAASGVAISVLLFVFSPDIRERWHVTADLLAMASVAGMVSLTGGANSQALVVVALFIAYQSWFFRSSRIVLRITGPIALIWSPLLYQDLSALPDRPVVLAFMFALTWLSFVMVCTTYFNEATIDRMRNAAHRRATTDPLTGAPNRRAFEERVEHELEAMAQGSSDGLALVMIDLDNFKSVNTEFGHSAGDELLVQIAHALSVATRAGDMVARVGGDEFAAVLTGAGARSAQAVAERFVAAVAQQAATAPDSTRAAVTASAGFALSRLHGATLDELMNAADGALMSMKKAGKAGVRQCVESAA